jgi:hypothetical protein
MGIRTIDELGKRPAFGAAVGRSLVKLWGPILGAVVEAVLPTAMGVLRIGINDSNRNASLVSSAIWVLWMIVTIALAARKDRATLHDRAAHTRVILELEAG